jgi:hypothetical protein
MSVGLLIGGGLAFSPASVAWAQTAVKSGSKKEKVATVLPQFEACKFPSHAASDVANDWRELDWGDLSAAQMDSSESNVWRIFRQAHPKCSREKKLCQTALSTKWLELTVNVYLQGTKRWTAYKQLANYFVLTRNYYRQARINLKFQCSNPPNRIHVQAPSKDRIAFKFAKMILNPDGKRLDGFGNLPLGLAVLNDQIMDRRDKHKNPYFLPGKPIGHELGHVLGLAHVDERKNLMSQGTNPNNQLVLESMQAVIMRSVALSRFGAKVSKTPKW